MSVTIGGSGSITSSDGTVNFGDDNLSTTGTIPAAQLTGALPAVSGAALTALPATLPAASGANLTALNATNLATGTVATARLGTGTASSSNFLRGDGSWQAAGGGALTLIGTQDADGSSAALTQTGLTGFDTYMCVGSDLSPNTASEVLEIRVGDSSGVDSGVNDYAFGNFAMIENGTTSSGGSSADNLHSGVTAQHFNGTEEYCNLVFMCTQPQAER